MKIEDIEKRSLEYAKTATPSCVFGDFDKYAVADAFEHGANWRRIFDFQMERDRHQSVGSSQTLT